MQTARDERPSAAGRSLPPAFSALRHRDFRLLVSGTAVASAGYWALVVAQGWLVVELTDSKLLLGLMNACLSMPFLFIALPAGVIADRADRRRLMTLSRLSVTALMLLLAALTYAGLITLWLLALISLLAGCMFALDLPTRQSLAPELVEPHEVTNAVAINQLMFTGTTLIGPALGGTMLAWTGVGGAFLITAAGNLFLLYQVQRIRFPVRPARMGGRSVRREMAQGIGYVLRSPLLQPLIVLSATFAILGQPYQSFLPSLAKNVLEIGPARLGILYAAGGAGAIAGALLVASLGNFRRKGQLVLAMTALFGLMVIAVGASRLLPLTLVLLTITGLAGSITGTLNGAIMVTAAPGELRGRVMSINVLVFGLSPLGSLMIGALADFTSLPIALAASGGCLIAVAALTAILRPGLRTV